MHNLREKTLRSKTFFSLGEGVRGGGGGVLMPTEKIDELFSSGKGVFSLGVGVGG